MNIWQDSNNSVERKKINLDFQGVKYYFWQDEMEALDNFNNSINKFEKEYKEDLDKAFVDMVLFGECKVKVNPCVGHSVESEKDEFYDTLKKKIIDSWEDEGNNKGSDKPSS